MSFIIDRNDNIYYIDEYGNRWNLSRVDLTTPKWKALLHETI